MLRRILPVVLASCATLAASLWVQDEPGTQEPSLRYSLRVDGAEFTLEAGQPLKLAGEFRDPTVVLYPGETRQFTYAGLSLEYPASYVWEAEPDPGSINLWTMDGADLSLMVFESPFAFGSEEFTNSLLESFEGAEVQGIEMQLGGHNLTGYRLLGTLFDEPIRYEALDVPTANGARLLVLMDTTEHAGTVSTDYEEAVALLKQSFEIVDNQTAGTQRLAELHRELADLEAQLESLRVTFNEGHALLREQQSQIDAVRAKIAAQRGAQGEDF